MCLVTDDGAGRSDTQRGTALEADDAFWDDGRIQRVWTPRCEFDDGVHANSLEDAIACDGKVLAGDAAITGAAPVKPFRAGAVLLDLARATSHLESAVESARRHAESQSEYVRRDATLTLSLEAIGGVEALGRTLCALTGTAQAGTRVPPTQGQAILSLRGAGMSRSARAQGQAAGREPARGHREPRTRRHRQ